MLLGPSGPETAVLNADIKKKSDMNVIWELFNILQMESQSQSGRPKGTTNYSDDEAIEKIRQVDERLRRGEFKFIKYTAAAVYGLDPEYAAKFYGREKKRMQFK